MISLLLLFSVFLCTSALSKDEILTDLAGDISHYSEIYGSFNEEQKTVAKGLVKALIDLFNSSEEQREKVKRVSQMIQKLYPQPEENARKTGEGFLQEYDETVKRLESVGLNKTLLEKALAFTVDEEFSKATDDQKKSKVIALAQ